MRDRWRKRLRGYRRMRLCARASVPPHGGHSSTDTRGSTTPRACLRRFERSIRRLRKMTPPAAMRAESVEPADLSALAERLPTKSLAIYIAVFLVVWSLRATVFIHIDESIQSEVWRNLYSNAVKFTLWALPAFITLAFLRAKPLAYTKLTTRVNKRGLLNSAVVLVVWFSLTAAGESVISGRNIGAILSQRS